LDLRAALVALVRDVPVIVEIIADLSAEGMTTSRPIIKQISIANQAHDNVSRRGSGYRHADAGDDRLWFRDPVAQRRGVFLFDRFGAVGPSSFPTALLASAPASICCCILSRASIGMSLALC
jgi:hypothetical protein